MDNEREPFDCPICGGEAEVYYLDRGGEIVGCEHCLKARYWFEVEVDEA